MYFALVLPYNRKKPDKDSLFAAGSKHYRLYPCLRLAGGPGAAVYSGPGNCRIPGAKGRNRGAQKGTSRGKRAKNNRKRKVFGANWSVKKNPHLGIFLCAVTIDCVTNFIQ